MKTKMDANTLHSNLYQFTGSMEWLSLPLFRRVIVSEGARYLAENAGAWWLLEAIASHLTANHKWKKACRTNERLASLSFWTITKTENDSCVLEAREDSDCKPVVTQKIEYTDFPFPPDGKFKLYVGNDGPGTYDKIFLPSEY